MMELTPEERQKIFQEETQRIYLEEKTRFEARRQMEARQPQYNDGIAVLLALVIPGGGHFYKQQIGSGFAWFVTVIIGYFCLIVPGLILHIISIARAYEIGRENRR